MRLSSAHSRTRDIPCFGTVGGSWVQVPYPSYNEDIAEDKRYDKTEHPILKNKRRSGDFTVMTPDGVPAPTLDPEFNRILQQRDDELHQLPPTVAEQVIKPIQTTIEPAEPEHKKNNTPFREWVIITGGTRLQDQTAMALDALADINDPPFIFHRARELVRIAYDENGTPSIVNLNVSALRGILERCASFVMEGKKGNHIPVPPPLTVVQDLANLPEWNTIFPISGIVECPIIRGDGTVVTDKGYDRNTRLYYAPADGFVLPAIPEKPSKDDVKNSIVMLKEIFIDFPFVDAASRINTIATLLSAVLRPIISGSIPLSLLDKPQAGTGASLIAEVVGQIVTGRSTSMTPAPEDDAAWRKMITSSIMKGRVVNIIDNVESKLYVPSLAVALTCTVWEDRILGKNEMITLPNRNVWIATGNNIQLGGDLPRRCFWVRMDACCAKPWQERKKPFKHPDLLEWVNNNRGEILKAILILAKSWIQAKKPKPLRCPKMGGFENWRDTIGGILEYANEYEFLGNLEQMYLEADTDTPAWEAFFEKWVDIWNVDIEITVADIEERLNKEQDPHQVDHRGRLLDNLPDAIADAWAGKKNFNRVLGNQLSKMNQRVYTNGLKIVKGAVAHHATQWKVVRVFDKTGELQKKLPPT